jgi:hypothetical protein
MFEPAAYAAEDIVRTEKEKAVMPVAWRWSDEQIMVGLLLMKLRNRRWVRGR